MMQHQEQETRETLPRPWLHDRLKALAKRIGQDMTPLEAKIAIHTMADVEELRWNNGMQALGEEIRAIDAQGGFIGGFAPDQWQQITDGLRAIYRPHMGQVPTPDELVEQLKAHLEQQEGGELKHGNRSNHHHR